MFENVLGTRKPRKVRKSKMNPPSNTKTECKFVRKNESTRDLETNSEILNPLISISFF